MRLLERLREDESGVYSPSARITTFKYPEERCALTISFGCAPENVKKLTASALDEIEKIKTNGPEQIYLDKYKAETRRSLESVVKTNNFWVKYITAQLQDQLSLTEVDSYNQQLKAMDLSSIKDTAEKYLSGKNLIKLILLPKY